MIGRGPEEKGQEKGKTAVGENKKAEGRQNRGRKRPMETGEE